MSLFKTKDYSKTVYGGGQKQSEWNTKSVTNFFKLKKENEAIKYRIIRDIRTFFKQK